MRLIHSLTATKQRFAFAGAAIAAALAAAACGGSTDVEGDRIFESAPWTGPEHFVYRLSDRGLDGEPVCELVTEPEVEPGVTRLEEHCRNDEFEVTDDTIVRVNAANLEPISSERTIIRDPDEPAVTHAIDYEDGVATFSTDDGERRRETTRDLPEPTDEHPDPGWYDDKSLFWLVRGLPLAQGYEGRYVHVINVGQPRVLTVDVEVEGRESVEVPAGTFEAWKVRVERDNTVYLLWVAEGGAQPVVKARIESITYELVSSDVPG